MTLKVISDFLESSTIHGLVHISTAKSKTAKALWVVIVVACFSIAIHMIIDSYKEWQESPVSTTITTHPITELEFPMVTVCPPRGSNTALNHLLEKVKDVNFTKEERQMLLDTSKEVFIEIPNKNYAEQMTEWLSIKNMRSIANGQASVPEVDDQGIIILRSSEPQGSFSSPSIDFKDYLFKYELNLPENIGELVGEGDLVISVETKGNWTFFEKNGTHLFKEKLNASAAENFCVNMGGHLASVGSPEENKKLAKVADGNEVWLGGKRKLGGDGWEWLDGRLWTYQNWWYYPIFGIIEPSSRAGHDCLILIDPGEAISEMDGDWISYMCDYKRFFICVNQPIKMTGNQTLVFKGASLVNQSLYFWTNKSTDNTQGFKLSWQIENGSLPDVMELVSKDLEGNVSTPGLGSLPPPNYYKERHEYTAVIELPHNVTDAISDGALIIDVDIVADNQSESRVELVTGEASFYFNNNSMNWSVAKAFCVSKGGHLASMASPSQWQRLKDFITDNNLSGAMWLGGTKESKEGEWTWNDGSEWSVEHWGPPVLPSARDESDGQICLAVSYSYIYSNNTHSIGWLHDSCITPSGWQSICSVPTMTTLNSSTQVVFTSENISTSPAIQVRWVAQPSGEDKEKDVNLGLHDAQNNLQNTSLSSKEMPGFKITWELHGKTNVNSEAHRSRSEWGKIDQKSSNKRDLLVMAIMDLVRESKIKRIPEHEVWKTLLKHRWDIDILRTNSPCLNENQRISVIYKTAQDLKIKYNWNHWIPEGDLRLGTELYSVLSCPENLIEAAKLSKLFESLLNNHNLNTVVAATMHNIQPRAGDNIKDFAAINMWFQRLDERYNFSLGNNILPLMTTDSLTQLTALDPPFLTPYKNNAISDDHKSIAKYVGIPHIDLTS